MGPLATHTKPKSAVLRLMVSHGWCIRSPTTDTPQGERDCVGGCGAIGETPRTKGETCGFAGVSPFVQTSVEIRAIQTSEINNSKP